MKKYITLAALFAAGTAFANTPVTLLEVDLTSNVETWEDTSAYRLGSLGWELKNTTGGISTSLASATNGTYETDELRPNVNVGTGGEWTLDFTIKNTGSETVTIESVTLNAFTFSGNGTAQNSGNYRYFNFSLGGTDRDKVKLDGSTIAEITIDIGDIVISAGKSHDFSLIVSDGTEATNDGSFIGLSSMSFSGIPEPSAFGLLAGLGALAVVGTRRRRK